MAETRFANTKQMKGGADMRILHELWNDEEGIGTVEIILILVVLIGLVIIFKKQLTDLVNKIFEKINSDAGQV